jgi:hypothetical protein
MIDTLSSVQLIYSKQEVITLFDNCVQMPQLSLFNSTIMELRLVRTGAQYHPPVASTDPGTVGTAHVA